MIGGVYLAYPIDQRGPALLTYLFEQIEAFKQGLAEAAACAWVFDPGDAFSVSPKAQPDDSIALINRAAATNADAVAVFLPRGVPTIGVPMELDRALAQGKRVLLFTDVEESWMLQDPRLRRAWRGDWGVPDSIDAAVEWLTQQDPPEYSLQYDDLYVKIDVPGCKPTRAYADDAGLDLYVAEDTAVPLGEFRDVPCGISVMLPPWAWGQIAARSSAFRRRRLLVLPGVIDAGYRGPLYVGVTATQAEVHLKKGERIAQLIVHQNSTRRVSVVEVPELAESERGTKGFGSSGA